MLAHLVGPVGKIHAYEIDASLAARAKQNLAHLPWVEVRARSGIADHLPKAVPPSDVREVLPPVEARNQINAALPADSTVLL